MGWTSNDLALTSLITLLEMFFSFFVGSGCSAAQTAAEHPDEREAVIASVVFGSVCVILPHGE